MKAGGGGWGEDRRGMGKACQPRFPGAWAMVGSHTGASRNPGASPRSPHVPHLHGGSS
mgnify:CR=1 FL=1